MHKLVTGKEMKLLDKNTSEIFHVPEIVLMEQAALCFVQELFAIKQDIKSVLILCGSGNNGADGLAAARLLSERGVSVTALLAGEAAGHSTSGSYKLQKQICGAYGLSLIEDTKLPEGEFDIVADALFGIGLSREVTGVLAALIDSANKLETGRVSIDISSGINADNGQVLGTAFRADDTITFSYGKAGQYLWPGCEYSGNIHVMPMGITEASWLDGEGRISVMGEEDLSLLPVRAAHSNKGTYGKLLIIAGSVGMAGAAVLCAKAAYNMGCGLVKVFTPEENREIIQSQIPEALFLPYDLSCDTELSDAIEWADAVVAGPGTGTGNISRHILEVTLKNSTVPLLLDADALNIIASDKELLKYPKTKIIVTPHLGEMSRLTGKSIRKLQSDLINEAEDFSKENGLICVLKDFRTVTACGEGKIYLNLSGNSGMATAGSGDVLAGLTGSLLAQGVTPELAAPLGAYIHGLAGDRACEFYGERALLASDIIDGIKGLKL